MEHPSAIALTPAQREAITRERERTQAGLVRLQWELHNVAKEAKKPKKHTNEYRAVVVASVQPGGA